MTDPQLTTPIVTLDALEVLDAAEKAMNEGRLAYQVEALSGAHYRTPQHCAPCAIGAALDDETAGRLDNVMKDAAVINSLGETTADELDYGINCLMDYNIVAATNEAHGEALHSIQHLHDNLCLDVARLGSIDDANQKFAQRISALRTKLTSGEAPSKVALDIRLGKLT